MEYVGLRADRINRPGTPNLDVFIFGSESDAAAQMKALAHEAHTAAIQNGLFVTVPLHRAQKMRKGSNEALGCARRAPWHRGREYHPAAETTNAV